MSIRFLMAVFLAPAVWASTSGEQAFELLGKAGNVIWIAEDIGGEYCLSRLHQIVIEPNRVSAGASDLKEYQGWRPVRDMMGRLAQERVLPLKRMEDGSLTDPSGDLTITAPSPDPNLLARFHEHIAAGGSNALTWAAAIGSVPLLPPQVNGRRAHILYRLPAGLYVNYALDRGWYIPQSGLILILTRQPVRAVGMDTMHGLLVLRAPLQHKED